MRTTSRRRRTVLALPALLGGTALALAACSGIPEDAPNSEDAEATVTFRIWDDTVAAAYEESFETFTEQHPEITVDVQVVAWEDYWDRLPEDLEAGTMADVFWTNTANFGAHADTGQMINLDEAIGGDHDAWTEPVADLYRRDGIQWGVPQLWESTALYYNTDLLEEAGVEPASLRWDPTGAEDTLVGAAQALTVDAEGSTADEPGFDAEDIVRFGFNAQHDAQAIWLSFLAENGGRFQDGSGRYTFATPPGEAAFGYVVDLIQTHQVAPAAEDTNNDPAFSRELFLREELALFQAGPSALAHLVDAGFDWDLAPKVEGPRGRISVVHGVAAVGSAHAADSEATIEVLRWLGSAQGQRPLGESGAGIPGVVEAQEAYAQYWAGQDVDVQVFLDAVEEGTTPAPLGPRASGGSNEISPVFQDMFAGRIEVPQALRQAQQAANEAIAD
ncbi:ABC transporter substrate-binding protein [Pseudactinotalea sp. Z1732]|uniref:ABC transporter substrate-binding protein n=1 Tax=Micrococcales TaxID=85006 RepID=UPI003C7CA71F